MDPQSFRDGFETALVLMASLHGLLLALILFFNNRLRSKSNRFLAIAILAASVVLSLDIIYYFDIEDQLPIVLQYIPLYWRSAVPVGIFFFVLYLINPKHQLSGIEKWGVVFIAAEVFTQLLYIPVNIFSSNEDTLHLSEGILEGVEQLIGLVASFLFFGLANKRVSQYQKYLYNNYSTTNDKSLKWVQWFLWINIGITLLWLVSFVQAIAGFYDEATQTFVWATISLGFSLFFIGYYLILKYNWFYVVPIEQEKQEDELQKNKLSSKTDTYYQNLLQLMKEEKLYTNVELTLQNLSEQLGISPGYISRIINEKEGKNFFEFVNTYRVEEVKEKLVDEEYHHYSILGIGLESGFKSKSTFHTVFKKFTGQTPSSYKKQFS